MRVPYYGEITFAGRPFCDGCGEVDLIVNKVRLFADAEAVERCIIIECKNLNKCIHLNEARQHRGT